MEIRIRRLNKEELDKLGVDNWSPWECPPSSFPWEYDATETAYIIEGKAKIKTENEEVEIKGGDLVTFPEGLKCEWEVEEKIKKVYTYKKV